MFPFLSACSLQLNIPIFPAPHLLTRLASPMRGSQSTFFSGFQSTLKSAPGCPQEGREGHLLWWLGWTWCQGEEPMCRTPHPPAWGMAGYL
jgi:hypothetical protein